MHQSPPLLGPAAIALLAAALCGCSGLGLALGESAVDHSLSTGGIQKVSSNQQPSKVAESDWKTVRRGIARTTSDPLLNGTLNWRNPETGTTGTLTVLDSVTATDSSCLNFQTTVNDVRGIRHYRGEACETANGRWELFGVIADDSKLL